MKPTVEQLCERLADVQAQRDVIAGQLKEADTILEEVKDALLAKMIEEGTEIVRAKGITASVSKNVVPQVVDWTKFEAYVLRHKKLALFQRRVSAEAWREELESRGNKPVPGVSEFEKVGIRINKVRE